MNAFQKAWEILKINVEMGVPCASCFVDGVPTAELHNDYNPSGGPSNLCKTCWDEEMDWRIGQQQQKPEHSHLFPLLPWPMGEYE